MTPWHLHPRLEQWLQLLLVVLAVVVAVGVAGSVAIAAGWWRP